MTVRLTGHRIRPKQDWGRENPSTNREWSVKTPATPHPPTPARSYWPMMATGEGKSTFFRSVDFDKLPVLKWTALYPHTYCEYEMNSVV